MTPQIVNVVPVQLESGVTAAYVVRDDGTLWFVAEGEAEQIILRDSVGDLSSIPQSDEIEEEYMPPKIKNKIKKMIQEDELAIAELSVSDDYQTALTIGTVIKAIEECEIDPPDVARLCEAMKKGGYYNRFLRNKPKK